MEIVDDPKTLASFSNDDILNGLEFPQDVEEALKEVKEDSFYLLNLFSITTYQYLCLLYNGNVVL